MKVCKYLILFVFTASLLWRCGDGEPDPVINEEEDIFGFGILNEENLIDGIYFVAVPDAMSASSDPCAITTSALVFSSNAYLFYQTFFFPLTTDNKSTSPIEQLPGHGNYRVYEWAFDAQTGYAIQLSESGNDNYHAIYIKENGGAYTRFILARENKNGKDGEMEIYDGVDVNTVILRYTWYFNDDGSREITTEQPDEEDYRVFVRTYPDASGEMEYSQDGQNTKYVVWDADGNGTWQEIDDQGNIVDEGSWTI